VPLRYSVVLIICLALLAILAREWWLFNFLPAVSDSARARGDRARARRILEAVLRHRALLGGSSRAGIHYRLAWSYLEEGRAQEAAEQARKSIAQRTSLALESLYRSRLADCLEACGDMAGAAVERERSRQTADAGPASAAQLMARGKALRKDGRYAESIPVYERAIELAANMAPDARAHLMVSLALSCWEAGRIHQALSWAEQALALQPNLTHRIAALSTSALALGNLGRLDDAEERWNLAFIAAAEAGNTAQAARFLATSAEIQRRRGKLVEAIATCERAAGMSLDARRPARFVQFECLLTWGRFAEARQVLEQGANARGFAVPASERRTQALTALNAALLTAEEERPGEALAQVDVVRDVLQNDEKVGVTYHAIRTWLEALLGLRAESESSARSALACAARMPDDRSAQLRCHTYLGRAALAVGEAESARLHFESCINLGPDPAEVPRARYFLGECRRAAGDLAGARAEWQAAVDTGLETRYVALARRRLQESAGG
jgi:tetratricopeptide (TPR) repeat protein